MLTSTFCHVPGISARCEQRLWAAGIRSWDGLDGASMDGVGLGPARAAYLRQGLDRSRHCLQAGDARYFSDGLVNKEHWRLFPEFRSSAAYLDIETTGLGAPGDYTTTIALYDGRQIRHYVRDQNLHRFAEDIREYKLLVSYNGKCFDLPFLRQDLGLRLDQAHIDLRYVLKSLGYGGGLKSCEKQLGLERGELAGVDGFMAVRLWWRWHNRRDAKALETLLAYNIQDVVNLEQLLVLAYNLKIAATPFAASHRLPLPTPPMLPFTADEATVRRLSAHPPV